MRSGVPQLKVRSAKPQPIRLSVRCQDLSRSLQRRSSSHAVRLGVDDRTTIKLEYVLDVTVYSSCLYQDNI